MMKHRSREEENKRGKREKGRERRRGMWPVVGESSTALEHDKKRKKGLHTNVGKVVQK